MKHNKALLTFSTLVLATSEAFSVPPLLPQPSPELRKIFPFSPMAEKQKRILPVKPVRTTLTEGFYTDRIIVKFTEKHKIRLEQNQLVHRSNESDSIATKETGDINQLLRNMRANPSRLFNQTEQALDDQKLQGEALSHQELEDLNSYYLITLNGLAKQDIEALIDQLNRSNLVEIAYPPSMPSLPVIGTPADVAPVTPQFSNQQGYLDAAPGGTNARWAWTNPPFNANSRGNGIRLTDIEFGWNLQHEDLGFANGDLLNLNSADNAHGTAVLGEIIGADNAYGVTGIASQVDISMFGIGDTANAVTNVSNNTLRAGDVMGISKN
jgi:hypothetical protein